MAGKRSTKSSDDPSQSSERGREDPVRRSLRLKSSLKEKGVAQPRYSPKNAVRNRKRPFPFLKLPAEIRNTIYMLSLVSEHPIRVDSLSAADYKKESKRRPIERTIWPSWMGKKSYVKFNTSYRVGDGISKKLAVAMLALNQMTYREAMPIFYGMNTFLFEDADTMEPFLSDRPDALEFMSSFHITISLQHVQRSHPRPFKYGHGCASWARVFTCITQNPRLKPKRLFLEIEGDEYDLNLDIDKGYSFKFKRPFYCVEPRWFDNIAGAINNLDLLGLTYRCDMNTFSDRTWPYKWVPIDAAIDNIDQQLWNFLAPRLLKRIKNTGHDGATLDHRRMLKDKDEVREEFDESKMDYANWRRYE